MDDHSELMETVSYHLPVLVIEAVTELAALRLRRDKMERRAAKMAGEKKAGQARRSGSAVIREALEAHMPAIQAEISELKGEAKGAACKYSRIPLTDLPRQLLNAGFDQPTYRNCYNAVLDTTIPATKNESGRWTIFSKDIPSIAKILNLQQLEVS